MNGVGRFWDCGGKASVGLGNAGGGVEARGPGAGQDVWIQQQRKMELLTYSKRWAIFWREKSSVCEARTGISGTKQRA